MATIHFVNGQTVEFENVFVKVSGWVKAYNNSDEGNEVVDLMHYPPSEITKIEGKATHSSPHGGV